jgi:hypothetical protein
MAIRRLRRIPGCVALSAQAREQISPARFLDGFQSAERASMAQLTATSFVTDRFFCRVDLREPIVFVS